jgi:anti-sigma regulatory factor (Ser/Thr protein kinase)
MSPVERPSDRLSTRFDQHGPASVEEATRLRRQLTNWLRDLGTPADIVDTIGLATYEAMANVVTHAYPPGTAGHLELRARLSQDAITVTVTDRGRWKPARAEREPSHGRGLLLIRNLADQAEVSSGEHGTTVSLRWPR